MQAVVGAGNYLNGGGPIWRLLKDRLVNTYDIAVRTLAVCAGVIIFVVFLLIVLDVLLRTTSNITGVGPPAFTIAAVEYILLYFTMFAAPWLVRIKAHVFIDAVSQLLARRAQIFLAKLSYLVCTISATAACYVSLQLTMGAIETGAMDVRGVDMPQWLLFLPMPPCFLLVAIEFLRYLTGFDDMYGARTDVRETV